MREQAVHITLRRIRCRASAKVASSPCQLSPINQKKKNIYIHIARALFCVRAFPVFPVFPVFVVYIMLRNDSDVLDCRTCSIFPLLRLSVHLLFLSFVS